VWWTSAQEPRCKSKTLHKPNAAPRREHPIDVTRGPVADESRTCRQHTIRAQGRVFNRACSRHTQEDRCCDRVPCQQKHRFLPARAFMTAVNITITRIPRLCLSPRITGPISRISLILGPILKAGKRLSAAAPSRPSGGVPVCTGPDLQNKKQIDRRENL